MTNQRHLPYDTVEPFEIVDTQCPCGITIKTPKGKTPLRICSLCYEQAVFALPALVRKMREAQKEYFLRRTREWLIAAKEAERAVDDALEALR
jgi:hypothetical protein